MKHTLLVLTIACFISTASARETGTLDLHLPEIGNSAGSVISPLQEKRLGEAFMREVRQTLAINDDPEITDYIRTLGERLTSNSDTQGRNFNFFVVESPEINAFAGPGGYLGVNSGLILSTESESELASVVAHEIAHVTQQHLARSFEKADRLSIPAMAALAAALIIGSRSGEVGQAAVAAVQAGAAQAQINFTRGNEEEADRVGLQSLARAGYDPRSMPVFFERLQQAIRFEGNQAPEFLRTHPVTSSRIADTRNRAEQFPYRQIQDSLEYHLARAKLRVLSEANPRISVKRFAEALKQGQYRNERAEHYGYALALLKSGETAAARTEAQQLISRDKENFHYLALLAQIEMADRQSTKALDLYGRTLELYPGNRALTLLYSQALLQAGQPDKARRLLQSHLRHRSAEPAVYQLLAQAAGQTGRQAEAHQAQAEYYYLNGQTGAAIQQLTLALGLKDTDFYLASQIEARLKELKDEAAQVSKE
ncbi:MAG TPA: M48 family metalloprotease [Gammaproteobacteria bacterium]|nr:M48 family metalloprotease [Gammaproteobacteria bacterium]